LNHRQIKEDALKRFFAVLFLALFGCGLTAPSYAGELGLFVNRPVPYGKCVGGELGQKCTGWGLGASYTVNLKDNLFAYGEVGYHRLPNSQDVIGLSPMKVLEGSLNLKYRTCGRYKVKPYILLGLGLAQVSFEIDTMVNQQTSSSTELVLRGGAGLDFSITKKTTLFAEAFAFESHNVSMIPLRAGIRFNL
jgi:opacity protein-like surface antigen